MKVSTRFSLRVSVVSRRSAGQILIEVDGELDLLTAPYLRGSLIRAINDRAEPEVFLDLSRVTFVDVAGWDPISSAGEMLAERGARLVIVAASARVRRLMEVVEIGLGVQVKAAGEKSGAWNGPSGPPEEVRGCYYLG
ncbi:MAG: STAS domain-containing protein [Acidimicrobiia bacterium]